MTVFDNNQSNQEDVQTAKLDISLTALQLRGVDVNSAEDLEKFLIGIVPDIAKVLMQAQKAPKSRGCSVIGTVSTGPGGTSGSATVTCTL